ncbi:MAG: multidrug efflux RND transporter permease subunit [Verrucomicrobiia bacterium]
MCRFFINRPIVAMVIAIVTVILGVVAILGLPIARFPNIVPPEILVQSTYVGADALTVEESVATPIEQQMSGVDNMNYMYSVNANNGQSNLRVNFDVKTNPNTDQMLTQMRLGQAQSQLPTEVNNYGIIVRKVSSSPLMVFALYSPKGTYDEIFIANYAYININDPLSRVPGIGQVQIYGAGQYAMRLWVKPDRLAQLGVTVSDITNALNAQNTTNPSGQISAEPSPDGAEYTYTVRSQGRLVHEEEFKQIVIRANPDGSLLRVKDVARVELGAQLYNIKGLFNGKPGAVICVYQLPDSNAIDTATRARKLMEEWKKRFPKDIEYTVALDTTESVTEGIKEIIETLYEALILVIIVVFVFLQGWRATLIPLLAVPVSLVGTFAVFPLLGFSINTLSLFGLVLAIGLVVDDAIVVVEAVEHHIAQGLSPKEATLKAMEQVSGPVVAIALILAAVFIPTAFIPGITGQLYQQFAITIAISVLLSAFNALSLSPALSALLLRPKQESKGLLQRFYGGFNRLFGRTTNGYVSLCSVLIRKSSISLLFLLIVGVASGWIGGKVPMSFLPDEDQGYVYGGLQLPNASSLQRTTEACLKADQIIRNTPGVECCTTIVGFSLISNVAATYSGFFFIKLKPWADRKTIAERYRFIMLHLNRGLQKIPDAFGFAFPPPAIPGVGTAGGVTFLLEDRAGRDVAFLAENVEKFVAAARQRPELGGVLTTFLPSVPQQFVKVDRDRVLRQGVNLSDVYQTLQCFMGGTFVNYFNRFGRQWQVYVEAEGDYRTQGEKVGQFYVRSNNKQMVPLSALTTLESQSGPEFTMRYNLYRCAQLNVTAKPGFSSAQAMKALEEVFEKTMPREMGYDYLAMSFQEKKAQQGISPVAIFSLSLLFVFLILAAQYESWSLPFSVLLSTPVAVFGAFGALMIRQMENNIYAQIGLVMLIGLAAKNAILIVEFARTEHEGGKDIADAALAGAKLRLRPILMTSFAFILGCVPLAIASGSGALARQVMGTVVIGGMLAATGIAIFLIPVMFYLVEKWSRKKTVTVEPTASHPLTQ